MFTRITIITLALFMAGLAVAPTARSDLDPSSKAEALESYGNLPMSFEANWGQSDAQVKFLTRGGGYRLFLTASEAILYVSKDAASKTSYQPDLTPMNADTEDTQAVEHTALRMQLVGANPQPHTVGLEEPPGKVNYILGNDPQKWHTDIPTYAKIKYEAVYPGVDLVYYGNQHQLEYDLVLAPGADPKIITLGFDGADSMVIDAKGDLVLYTAGGQIRLQKPLVYQEVESVRQEIPSGYVLLPFPEGASKGEGLRQVGFQVGAYDVAKALVIDPVLSYSTYLGGSSLDMGRDIAVDAVGNAYVVGSTGSPDFPTVNPVQPAFRGPTESSDVSGPPFDIFVAKINATGTALVYATYLGGSQGEEGSGIAVDAEGNAYVTGGTFSPDFPTANPLQRTQGGSSRNFGGDAFVVKLNATGTALVYATFLGGNAGENPGGYGGGIAVDATGNAYVTGWTTSTNFPTVNPLQRACGDESQLGDAFVAKVDPTGSALVYATCLGGSSSESGRDIAVDGDGNAYVMGETGSPDFPTVKPLQPKHGGNSDIFVTKLNPAGSALVYATYLGGGSDDYATGGIAVDAEGNAYVTGETTSWDFPAVNPVQLEYGGGGVDVFVAKVNPTGSALVYATYLGGSGGDGGSGIAVDADGSAYVTGSTDSPDFPTANPIQPTSGGGTAMGIHGEYIPGDAFVVKVNPKGKLLFSTYLGGSGHDGGASIAVDADGNAYVLGSTSSLDFPTVNPMQPAKAGSASQEDLGGPPPDAIVVRIADLPAATATPVFVSLPIPGWLLVGLILGVVAIVLALARQRRLTKKRTHGQVDG